MTEQDLMALADQELDELAGRVRAEQERRAYPARIATVAAQVIDDARAAGATTVPAPEAAWVQPTSAVDAYRAGDTVTHQGAVWESLTTPNVWEPGVAGWREQGTDGVPPAWVQPTGAADAYQSGDQVTFEGQTWESTIDANTWSPSAYPAGWKAVTTGKDDA